MGELWSGCLRCREKCCGMDVAHPLFVTQQEMENIEKLYPDKAVSFNKTTPCSFLMRDGMCMIHESKPVDCRLFPFDIVKTDKGYFWIVWNFNCHIFGENGRFEEYLRDMERSLIPQFIPYLDAYSAFRFGELNSKYEYEILREIQIDQVLGEKPETSFIEADLIGMKAISG